MSFLAHLRCAVVAGVVLALVACGGGNGPSAQVEPIAHDDAEPALEAQAREALQHSASPSSSIDGPAFHYDGSIRDAIEFFRPHPGGNGRSCATCHRPEDNFALTPKTVEARWQLLQKRRQIDPGADDPLFRPIDADDFANDFTTLRTKALVRVTLPLPANVKRADDASATTISVLRAVPTVINAQFTGPFQHDGRESTLEAQALSAMRAHSEVAGDPAPQVLSRIAGFQRHLFSSACIKQMSRALDDGAAPPSSDPPLNALEEHGRKTFDAFCASCHGGATQTKNTDARFLPLPARGPLTSGAQAFVNIFVGTPRPPPPALPPPAPPTPRFFDGLPTAGLPDVAFRVTLPTQAEVSTLSSDPGRGLISGDLREFGRFDVPTLFGIAKTAPYFHDNSAADLDAVIEHYQAMFRFLEFLDVEGGLFAPQTNGQGCALGACGFKPIPASDVAALKALSAEARTMSRIQPALQSAARLRCSASQTSAATIATIGTKVPKFNHVQPCVVINAPEPSDESAIVV